MKTEFLRLFCLLLIISAPALARRGHLMPSTDLIRHDQKSYSQCRKKVVAELKSNRFDHATLRQHLRQCNEQFPNVGFYLACKKKALATAQTNAGSLQKELRDCRQLQEHLTFKRRNPVPFWTFHGKLLFGGINLNQPMGFDFTEPGNFDCKTLREAIKAPAQAEHILFGNHPSVFKSLSNLNLKALSQRLRPHFKDGILAGFGQLDHWPPTAKATLYFPSSFCHFDTLLGRIFSDIKVYYLIDPINKELIPYFGVGFYKQPGLTSDGLISKALKRLGNGYKKFSKDKTVTYLSKRPFHEFDSEGDPKNLCRTPRIHDYVAIVRKKAEDPTFPEYLLLASIKNLCDYGDRLSSQFNQ